MANMRTIGVRLRLVVDAFRRDAQDAGNDADKMASRIERAGKKSSKGLEELVEKSSTTIGVVGGALVAAAGAAVFAFAKFDRQMSEVGAVADATGEDMDRLREAALEAGKATVFSATEAAQAEAELAKAGVSTADILDGALTGALNLAAAGSIDLAQAATIAAAAMNTFKLGGKDVGHIADVLAAAANKSSAGVGDLAEGLQQVGLIAAQVGLDLDSTVGVLAAFADYGLKGSDGATSLKTALLRLAAPTGEAKSLMDKLGISMYDSTGQMVGAADIAGQLEQSLKDLTPAQRNAALNTIFGSDAIRAATILYAEGKDGIRDYIDAVNDKGAADRMAAQLADNLIGDVDKLKGSLETLFITSGKGGAEGLRPLIQGLDKLVSLTEEIPAPLRGTATALVGVSGAALLATVATVKLRLSMKTLTTEAIAAGVATTGTARAMRFLGRFGSLAILEVVGLTLALEGLEAAGVELPGWLGHLNDEVKLNKTVVGQAAEKQKILNETLQDQLGPTRDLVDIWDDLNGVMVNADEQALEAAKAIDDLAESFTENGASVNRNTRAGLENVVAMQKAAKQAVEAAQAYLEQTGDVEGAKKMLKNYEDQAIKAAGATGKQKDAVKRLADELYRLPESKTFTLNVRGTGQLQRVVSQLDRIERSQGATGRRWGGITEHAESGLLRDASTYAPRAPARYAFAEPATGGEAFVPKRGNYSRSMGILNQAAGWYGAQVVPQGGYYAPAAAVGGQTIKVDVTVRNPEGRVLHNELVNYALNSGRTPAALFPDSRGR